MSAFDIMEVAKMVPNKGPFLLFLRIAMDLLGGISKKQDTERSFAQLNNRLHHMEMQLNDLTNLVHQLHMEDLYFNYLNDIKFQTDYLVAYLKSSEPDRQAKREDFFYAFSANHRDKPTVVLAQGIRQILQVTMRENNYNKTNTAEIGRNLLELVDMGATSTYAYSFLNNQSYRTVAMYWEKQLLIIQVDIMKSENQCVQNGRMAAQNTIKKLLANSVIRNQQQFTNTLHTTLSTTYNWLNWMVLVYNSDVKSSFNVFHGCNAIHVSGQKNIVAFYSNKNVRSSWNNINNLKSALYYFFSPKILARRMYDYLRKNGVKGKLFILRRRYMLTSAYDRHIGAIYTVGRLSVATFPENFEDCSVSIQVQNSFKPGYSTIFTRS